MPVLSTAIQNMLNGRIVRVGHLVEFQFDSPKYLWNGSRTIITSDGKVWVGLGQLGSIDGLEEEDDNLQASDVRFSLSGVDDALLQAAVAEDRSTYVGRLVLTKLHFFDEDWQLLDDPIARNASILEGIEVSWSANDDGTHTRVLTATATNIFYGRSVPPAGNYSNRDQQFRSPGDRGLEGVGAAAETIIPVPW